MHVEYGKQKKSIFENVWGGYGEPVPELSELNFTIRIVRSRIYFLQFNAWWCKAYCGGITQVYNYDLKSGNCIDVAILVDDRMSAFVLGYLSMCKSAIIKNELSIISNKTIVNGNSKVDHSKYTRMGEIYEECLEYSDFDSFDYFDFFVKTDSVILSSGKCSSHYDKDLDEISDFKYKFKITDIQKYLSAYGKEILL